MSSTYAPTELIDRAKCGDKAAVEKLVVDNTGLVWSIARRFFGRGVDSDDLYQLGCVGLLKAIAGFDSSFGTEFSTYAVPKITGEIRRFLRDDGTIKVSRSLKERANRIAAAGAELEQSLGRSPTLSELSEKTGLNIEDIAAAQASSEQVQSLQYATSDEGLTLEGMISDPTQEEKMLDAIALRQAIAVLPEKQRMVISLRYYRGMTQQFTADILKISQVQVSRLERRAVDRLRAILVE